MNLVDSSGWIEYFSDGKNAGFFAGPILNEKVPLIIPTIILYEVFKKILNERGEETALQIIAQLDRFQTVPLDETLALEAARISHEMKISMADSVIWATALRFNATLWTADEHFKPFPDVKYVS